MGNHIKMMRELDMYDCPECDGILGTGYNEPISCMTCAGFADGMNEERKHALKYLRAHGYYDIAQMIEMDGKYRDEQLKKQMRRRTGHIRRKRRGEPDRRKGG